MKKIGLVIGLLAVVLFTSVTNLVAQEGNDAICDKVKVIDAPMASRLATFNAYKGFQQAVLEEVDGGYQYRVYLEKDGILKTVLLPVTIEQLAEMCQEIELLVVAQGGEPNEGARRRLLFSTTTSATVFYGLAIPSMFKEPETKYYVASSLFIGAGGFFVPFLATRKGGITDGMARGYTMGTLMGIAHGVKMHSLVTGRYSSLNFYEEYWEETDEQRIIRQGTMLSMVLMGLGEGIGLTLLARHNGYTWGQMSSVGSGGLWGFMNGTLLPAIFNEEPNTQLAAASSLLFSAAGMAGGQYLYKARGVTHGDVSVINSYGALGLGLGLAIAETSDPEKFRPYAVGMFAGSLAGIGTGLFRTQNYHYTRFQGNMIALGEFAGALVGMGLTVLAEPENISSYFWSASIGAAVGLIGTDFFLREKDKHSSGFASNLNFQFNPYGLVDAFTPKNSTYHSNDYRFQNSLISLSLTF